MNKNMVTDDTNTTLQIATTNVSFNYIIKMQL